MKKFSELEYVRPDMEKAGEAVKACVKAMKTAASYAEFRDAYMEYVKLDTELATAKSIAHIRNTVNLMDEYYEKEMAYFNAEMPKYQLLVKEMGTVILESPFKKDMEAEFGRILIQNLEAGQLLSCEAVVEDKVREADLASLYSKTVAAASADFHGEKLNTYGLLKHMQSTDRTERREAFLAWAGLFESIAPEIDRIYDGLVKLRAGMAEKLGFENFVPMGYLARRRYDYTAKELSVFRKQVREVIVPACEALFERQREALGLDKLHYYDESVGSPEGNPVPVGGRDYLVAQAQKMYRELSPESGEFFDFMVQYDLFDLEAKKGKRVGGYCTTLPLYHAPFIFSNFNGTEADVNVLTHEAGHAFAGFTAAKFQKIPELCHSTSEINEIHSMGMELWTYPWMELFFGEQADQYRREHLADALKKIPYMVCVDEYQHRVYEKPDMTAMERRKVWRELEKVYMPWRDYDGNEFLENGGFWMQKQHIFMCPFYYIDYSLASMGALEYYIRSIDDRETAWEDYFRLCSLGGSKGYFELLKEGHLSKPFKAGPVEHIMKVLKEKVLQ